jgi:hypothetical protein
MAIQSIRKEAITEQLTPSPDGAQVMFSTSKEYVPGTVSVWINGLRKIQDWDDGFDELGGKDIEMREAPQAGDSIQARYEPR